ncbi:helix-turn-helix domain-containing protein [Acinetobacter bereziniae]|uniref:HTH araC/xylS-type domain-containing protein n=1 Tax=Acinetobacter bereziniae NIPH 3 TaxID=1217651 RepID=N8YKP6_ACIBZ|nr:AraC family transcriptional regulator [Acinetobacter bereziniae]ENV21899.1 hypothetical protein F963_02292 [Acinetobacter bereziniae NIPH 3]
MHNVFNLRKLYHPVQPTVKQAGKNVFYNEISPDDKLLSIIYCYWELKTDQILDFSFIYRVIADGCIDIFFKLDEPSESFVMGFCKNYTDFSLNNQFHYIGIRFLPTMFPALYNVNAKELSNNFWHLKTVEFETSEFIKNNFSGNDEISEIKNKLDTYFIKLIQSSNLFIDRRFKNAIDIIIEKKGVLNIVDDLNTGLCQRQLRRYFEYYIGGSTKTFSNVVRFQNALNIESSKNNIKYNYILNELGYYDQAHFIKDFKKFYGVTPKKVFRG